MVKLKNLYNDRLNPTITLTEMAQQMENTRVQMISGVAYEEPANGQVAQMNLDSIDELLLKYEDRNMNDTEEEVFLQLKENWATYSETVRENIELLSDQQYEETLENVRGASASFNEVSGNLTQLVEAVDNAAVTDYKNSQSVFETTNWAILVK